ncbi:MAG: RNA polymerase sigma factor [Oscillospiraceae bacterium]|nr:RNA polymerase sigma factor [Oscillospiraceae bacterium]
MLGLLMTTEYSPVEDRHELQQLLIRIAGGERDALAELYQRTRTAVYGLALSYLKNAPDAQDLTQDVYVQVWDCAAQYRPTGSPMGWLLTVCRNLSLMRLRRGGRHVALSEEEWDAIPAQECGLNADERALLQGALAKLADEERRIVLLHAVAGMKHREIAALLELPLPTVLSKYHRALKKMRSFLEGDDVR